MSEPQRRQSEALFPDVPVALLLTIAAVIAGGLVGVLFLDLGLLAAEGVGTALGLGGVATLAARRVAEPQAARIGLVGLDWRALPLIACLVPAILLASELDNYAYDLSPVPETKQEETAPSETEEPSPPLIDPDDPFSVLAGVVVSIGIAPIVHEFLFRGVIQQGLVAQLGVARGVTLASLLWTMLRPATSLDPARFAAAFVAWFALGWLLGMIRIATGSILGSILLSSAWAAIGFAALVTKDRVALPGMNVDGTHLPPWLALACLVLVVFGVRRMVDVVRLATLPESPRVGS